MGHGTVADEIKGRARRRRRRGRRSSRSRRRACAFAPTSTARERFLSPEISMAVQAQLHSDIVLAFDECTPFHVDRDYTARSTERTHRWLERCVRWRARARPAGRSLFYGDRPGRRLRGPADRVGRGGRRERRRRRSRSAARSARTRRRCTRSSTGARASSTRLAPERPRHLLGIGEVDDLIRGVELGIDSFDCAMPTRLARHGVALVARPGEPLAARGRPPALARRRARRCSRAARARPAPAASRAPTCTTSRARGELTGGRLLTLHNLTFIAALMARLRAAIIDGRLGGGRARAARRR